MDSGQRHFLFGITVSEIAFILFFILLLFSFFAIAKLEKENNNEKEGREQATAEAQDAVNSLRQIGEAFGKGAEIDPQEALTALKKGADAVERAAKQEQQLQELKAENERLQQEERLAKQEAAESRGELKETRGQLANLSDRAKKGHPPCWVLSEKGDIDFLFDVTMYGDETITVSRAASTIRDSDYFALPSVPEITNRRMTLAEFETLALPIYMEGQQQEQQCRHFVNLSFDDRNACSYFLIVEKYFYKSVRQNDRRICPQ